MKQSLLLLAVLVALTPRTFALFVAPSMAPTERLLASTAAHLEKNPRDAKAHYVMARVHYLSFHTRSTMVPVHGRTEDQPGVPRVVPDWMAQGLEYHVMLMHATDSTLEKMKIPSVTKVPPKQSDQFWKAVATKVEKLKKEGWKAPVLAAEDAVVHAVEAHRAFLKAKELDPKNGLYQLGLASPELLTPPHHVTFDLDGDGQSECWPWINPQAAFLVWDPTQSGLITSGRQLFGAYTFQLIWSDGYEPLAALDGNQDGALSGVELNGLRAWFDRNSDGVSQPGEVVDLATLKIEAISTKAERTTEGGHLLNPTGIRLTNGKTLPTWDWMVEPLRSSKK